MLHNAYSEQDREMMGWKATQRFVLSAFAPYRPDLTLDLQCEVLIPVDNLPRFNVSAENFREYERIEAQQQLVLASDFVSADEPNRDQRGSLPRPLDGRRSTA